MDYKIPHDVKLYSKKQIIDMIPEHQTQQYFCVYDGNVYNSFIKSEKCFAKQYPSKKLYYLV